MTKAFESNHGHPGLLNARHFGLFNLRHLGLFNARHPGLFNARHPGLFNARHPGLAPGSSQSAKARSFSTILALMLFPPAAAFADYQSGLDAYNAGFYANALRDWKQVADSPPSNTNPAIYA
jgi:hypothetical protein